MRNWRRNKWIPITIGLDKKSALEPYYLHWQRRLILKVVCWKYCFGLQIKVRTVEDILECKGFSSAGLEIKYKWYKLRLKNRMWWKLMEKKNLKWPFLLSRIGYPWEWKIKKDLYHKIRVGWVKGEVHLQCCVIQWLSN